MLSVPGFMASGGPLRGHRCHILWPVVGPSKAIGTIFYVQCWAHLRPSGPDLWLVVGPSKAIRTIFYGQRWAHSTLSVPDFMASSGPIQGHWDHILWPEVGLFNAIGARFYGQ